VADEQEPAEAPEADDGGAMHIHKPRPIHGFREFLSEISVIVVGVLIALGLEQAVEALHWRQKVEQAEVRLRANLTDDASYATQYGILKPCAEAYLDRMQADLIKHDAADMERLYEFGPPYQPEPWKVQAWESTEASQIGDHMATSRFEVYAEAFRGANLLGEFNLRYRDDYVTATTGRFALPPDTKAVTDQLAAVDRLRAYIRVGRIIAVNDVINPARAHLGVTPDSGTVEYYRQKTAKCLALLGPPSK